MLYNDIIKSYRSAPAGIEQFAALKLPNSLSVQESATGYDLLLYDCIGCGCVEADDIAQALALAGGAPVRVRINSPGGDAFEGFAVYNLLKSYKGELTVLIDGVAASAAAYVAMAADIIEMQPQSFMMIHNGWTVSIGDKNRLGTVIKALGKIDAAQTSIFAEKTGANKADIQAMLDNETWFSADEAVQFGLADSIVDPEDVAAQRTLPCDPDDDAQQEPEEMGAMLTELCAEFDRLLEADEQPEKPVELDIEAAFAFEKRRRLLQARLLTLHR
jgi:ATP-dependent Clp protease, protease subunit